MGIQGHFTKGDFLPYIFLFFFCVALKLFLLLQDLFYKIVRLTYEYRVLLPTRKLAFTKVNIMKAWEMVEIIPLNARRVIASETRSGQDGATTKTEPSSKTFQIPSRIAGPARTPRAQAVSRTACSAIALITQNTPASQKLKHILSDLNEGFQEIYADKRLEQESHRQY